MPVLRTLGTQPFFGSRLQVGGAAKVFDGEGRMIDDAVRARTEKFVAELAEFVQRSRRDRET